MEDKVNVSFIDVVNNNFTTYGQGNKSNLKFHKAKQLFFYTWNDSDVRDTSRKVWEGAIVKGNFFLSFYARDFYFNCTNGLLNYPEENK